ESRACTARQNASPALRRILVRAGIRFRAALCMVCLNSINIFNLSNRGMENYPILARKVRRVAPREMAATQCGVPHPPTSVTSYGNSMG
ncbi:MAG: hypothetical protein WB716_10485, partial [Candidatus Acidiferrales bacterium]